MRFFFPFRHLIVKKCAYVIAIVAIWVISVSLEIIQAFVIKRNLFSINGIVYFSYIHFNYFQGELKLLQFRFF